MRVLGIDPGSRATGYGIIDADGDAETVVDCAVIRLDTDDGHPMRLKQIYDGLIAVIEEHAPDICVVEMPVYAKNAQSMLKLGRAQAAAILVAMNRQVPVAQYTPKEIKKSVTGNGNASKRQVGYMVRAMLELDREPAEDAADALAVALCHAHRSEERSSGTHRDWSSFVDANPDRTTPQ